MFYDKSSHKIDHGMNMLYGHDPVQTTQNCTHSHITCQFDDESEYQATHFFYYSLIHL